MNRHGRLGPGDFKSPVYTYFTTRAEQQWRERRPHEEVGGATRSRTGLNGFAIRSITALLSRHGQEAAHSSENFLGRLALFSLFSFFWAANRLIQKVIFPPAWMSYGNWARRRAGIRSSTTGSAAPRHKVPPDRPSSSAESARD